MWTNSTGVKESQYPFARATMGAIQNFRIQNSGVSEPGTLYPRYPSLGGQSPAAVVGIAIMWLRTGFDSKSDQKNHRTETTVDTEGRNRMGFKPRFRSCLSQLRNLPRQARPNLQLPRNKFVPRQLAGFNPEEVLRKRSEHRFRPEGQIPKIGIWVEWEAAGARRKFDQQS
jgi:hypothetical protein